MILALAVRQIDWDDILQLDDLCLLIIAAQVLFVVIPITLKVCTHC